MKKLFLLMSMAATMFAFAGCQKNEVEAPNVNEGGSTFELVAEIAQTKTTLDGLNVDWEEGDIIYMVTSDGTWGKPYTEDNTTETIAEFTYSGGKFTTDATIAPGNYAFNAVYSNGKQMTYHRSDVTTNQLYAAQNQDCENPTAHIKDNDALVGTFTANVPTTEPVKMTMSHLYTMMQVDVKNNTGAAIKVTKFQMTAAGAALAGIFTVTAFDTPAITTKSGASETITVNVANGAVAAGESLPIYFVMAPLADYSGDVTFKVTDSEGNTYTKTVALNDISFEAGKYNTTPYTIAEADEKDSTYTIEWASNSDWTDNSKKLVSGDFTVTTVKNNGSTEPTVNANANDCRVYAKGSITVENSSANITKLVFNISAAGKKRLADITASTGNVTIDAKNWLVVWEGDAKSVTFTVGEKATYGTEGSSKAGQLCFDSIDAVVGSTSGGETPEPTTPVLTVTPSEINIAAAGGSGEISYSVANPAEGISVVASKEATWISDFNYATPGKITFTVAENTGDAREATVTLAYEGAESKTVTVKQAAPVQKMTVADVLAAADETAVEVEGIVVAKHERGILLSDNTGVVLVYKGSAVDAVVGDKVSVSGKKDVYNNWAQIASPTVTVVSSDNEVTYPAAAVLDGAGMDNLIDAESVSYIQYTGTLTVSGSYYNVAVEGAETAIGSIQYPATSLGLAAMNGKKIKVTGYHVGISSGKYVNTMATSVELVDDGGEEQKYLTVSPKVFNVPATQTSVTFTIEANVGFGLDETEGVNTSIIYVSDDELVMTLQADFDKNESSEPKTYVITIIPEEELEPVTVTINQEAASQGGGEQPVIVLNESFSESTGTMGWSGSAGSGTINYDVSGWDCSNAYGAGGSAKFGTGSKKGTATTPSFNTAGDMVLTFKAGAWDNSKEQTTLVLSINNGGTLSVTSVTMKKGSWTDYEVTITGATVNSTITFAGKNASNSRFFLDDVKIVKN